MATLEALVKYPNPFPILAAMLRDVSRVRRKLEAVSTDSTGLVPHSLEWVDYWQRWLIKWNADPSFRPRGLMPLEAARALIHRI